MSPMFTGEMDSPPLCMAQASLSWLRQFTFKGGVKIFDFDGGIAV